MSAFEQSHLTRGAEGNLSRIAMRSVGGCERDPAVFVICPKRLFPAAALAYPGEFVSHFQVTGFSPTFQKRFPAAP